MSRLDFISASDRTSTTYCFFIHWVVFIQGLEGQINVVMKSRVFRQDYMHVSLSFWKKYIRHQTFTNDLLCNFISDLLKNLHLPASSRQDIVPELQSLWPSFGPTSLSFRTGGGWEMTTVVFVCWWAGCGCILCPYAGGSGSTLIAYGFTWRPLELKKFPNMYINVFIWYQSLIK